MTSLRKHEHALFKFSKGFPSSLTSGEGSLVRFRVEQDGIYEIGVNIGELSGEECEKTSVRV